MCVSQPPSWPFVCQEKSRCRFINTGLRPVCYHTSFIHTTHSHRFSFTHTTLSHLLSCFFFTHSPTPTANTTATLSSNKHLQTCLISVRLPSLAFIGSIELANLLAWSLCRTWLLSDHHGYGLTRPPCLLWRCFVAHTTLSLSHTPRPKTTTILSLNKLHLQTTQSTCLISVRLLCSSAFMGSY